MILRTLCFNYPFVDPQPPNIIYLSIYKLTYN
jgi:hypothetical protein